MPKIASTQMNSKYTELRKESASMNEHNDCAVVAVALVCDVPYAEAHKVLAALGRKPRSGTYMHQTHAAVMTFGFEIRRVDATQIIATYPGVHKGLRSVTTHHPRRFPKAWDPSKRYLMHVRRHVLAVVDAETKDWSANKAKRAVDIYEVVKRRTA